jgi:glycosyltransferase involved in cell wall biosynthesis
VRQALKRLYCRLFKKDPEAVVVSFLSGDQQRALAMLEEIRHLVPEREHYAVYLGAKPDVPGVQFIPAKAARSTLRRKRIGLAPVLFTDEPEFRSLRLLAFRLAPTRILAYNTQLERFHLRLRAPISSALFLAGVPLDRIHLRPRWLCPWRSERSVYPQRAEVHCGRARSCARRAVAIVSPYFPYPLSHGGAVRLFYLLREAAKHFDVHLFCFREPSQTDLAPVLQFCTRVVCAPLTRYREPRWSTLLPPEAHEFYVPVLAKELQDAIRQYDIGLVQVEYTQMARYGGHILVEHDVTFDLYRQRYLRRPSLSTWWDWFRWRRFELRAVAAFQRVVVMSEKDRALLGSPHIRVIPNGVDLRRFRPTPEPEGFELLFVGSFRHFPNAQAYRFLVHEVWPHIREVIPGAHLTVVAGPDYELYWQSSIREPLPRADGVSLFGFVADVERLYQAANLVVVPTLESAGTNLKVLEALGSRRAVLSTSTGCAGLGLTHGLSVWVADTAADFVQAARLLLTDDALRHRIAAAGWEHVRQQFDWRSIAAAQRKLWEELLPPDPLVIRTATREDEPLLEAIQWTSPEAAQWRVRSYFEYQVHIAEVSGAPAGFIVFGSVGQESEVFNLAVAPRFRRGGVATRLLESVPGEKVHLEVRASNTAALRCYEQLGFEIVGRRAGYYSNPDEDGLVLCWRRNE